MLRRSTARPRAHARRLRAARPCAGSSSSSSRSWAARSTRCRSPSSAPTTRSSAPATDRLVPGQPSRRGLRLRVRGGRPARRFDVEAARGLGVTEGPDFGRLQRGETVNGVRPEQVVGRTRGRRIVISGDTSPAQTVEVYSDRAEVLVHEATFRDETATARARPATRPPARRPSWPRRERPAARAHAPLTRTSPRRARRGAPRLPHRSSRGLDAIEIRSRSAGAAPGQAGAGARDIDGVALTPRPDPAGRTPAGTSWPSRRGRVRAHLAYGVALSSCGRDGARRRLIGVA